MSSENSLDLRVFTLNCWGIKCVSKLRRERMDAIGKYLSNESYDVVVLQEVWTSEDFNTIREHASSALPFSHFFDNGIIGSGTCVLTKSRISEATFHEFTMNGYPHKVWHGDWFGGKGLGVCQILYQGFDIHIYTSHYHAEYSRSHDVYLGHRVIHALESAQWIKLASSSADLTIYAGDFNTEPVDVPYKLVRLITPLVDAWASLYGDGSGGETCEIPANSFSCAQSLREFPNGKRIDYVMYQAGPDIQAETLKCELPLPHRVPGKGYSYSDHEAVTATIRITRGEKPKQTAHAYRRSLSMKCRTDCVEYVNEALAILRKSDLQVHKDELRYAMLTFAFLLLLVLSFVPLVLFDTGYHAGIEVALFFPRFLLTICLVYTVLMASIFNKKERNALNQARVSLELIRDQDLTNESTLS